MWPFGSFSEVFDSVCSTVLPSRNLLFCLNRNEEFCCVLYNTIHVTSKCACHGFVTWSKLLQSIKIIGNKSVVTGNQSKSEMRIVSLNFLNSFQSMVVVWKIYVNWHPICTSLPLHVVLPFNHCVFTMVSLNWCLNNFFCWT